MKILIDLISSVTTFTTKLWGEIERVCGFKADGVDYSPMSYDHLRNPRLGYVFPFFLL